MKRSDFDILEQRILQSAPSAHRKLYEVKLRIARERLASGADVDAELSELSRDARARSRPPQRSRTVQ